LEKKGEVLIEMELDLITARKTARDVSAQVGFGLTDITRIVTAVSELARNIYQYAKTGAMHWRILEGDPQGIEFIFEDHGPGISNLEQVLEGGHSTSKGLGLGISGAKRLMDDIQINTTLGNGTKITISKWLRG
jgi:serine/threonine-protein kinase RsbT